MLESYLHYAIDDSYQGSIINWSYNKNTMETINKSWFNIKWQNASQNRDPIGCAVSSWLTHENVFCLNFQNTSLVGNFGPQIWLPDGHFGQFRAIGPMELLRPALGCTLQNLMDENSTLDQIMAWFCQAMNDYLSQCWPRSVSPYGVTRPQWVKHEQPLVESSWKATDMK